ncbi:hypothetical protein PsorP6_008493 [Peronosclerospora sorghi]|uniref:Uncharacterized protein n=1 Tax=Peronosclerospora sorghi TaxID=230839 RepID=A0ACC0WB06_9STRA|nr:hypothetical protein PsorP6_008493 [Peronosclerospora sorghi]
MPNNSSSGNSGPQQEQELLLLTPRRRLRSCSEAGRGASFNNADIDSLLALDRQQLPRGKEEWDLAAELYNAGQSAYGGSRRNGEQLRRKYNRLRKEADDKERSVRDAKQVQKLIEKRSAVFVACQTPGALDDEEELLVLDCAELVEPTLPSGWEDVAAE